MLQVLLRLGFGLLGAASVNYLAWRLLDINGAISIVLCSPLYAGAVASPVIELIGFGYQFTRELAFRKISGRYFEHNGTMIDVVEDADHYRWVRLADVRKVIAGMPFDKTLKRLYPDDVNLTHSPSSNRIKAEALARYLEKSTHANSLKFRRWLDKDVTFPAQQIRSRSQARP